MDAGEPCIFINGVLLSNSAADLYQVPAGKTIVIDEFTATNVDTTAPHTATIHFIPYGGSLGDANMKLNAEPLVARQAKVFMACESAVLTYGMKISGFADSANKLAIRASGRIFG